ncbi:MAG: hypothetical protein QOH82_2155 [Mycobacterium sp.]|nr:hypothetical protein [Mycobacterium sp.]
MHADYPKREVNSQSVHGVTMGCHQPVIVGFATDLPVALSGAEPAGPIGSLFAGITGYRSALGVPDQHGVGNFTIVLTAPVIPRGGESEPSRQRQTPRVPRLDDRPQWCGQQLPTDVVENRLRELDPVALSDEFWRHPQAEVDDCRIGDQPRNPCVSANTVEADESAVVGGHDRTTAEGIHRRLVGPLVVHRPPAGVAPTADRIGIRRRPITHDERLRPLGHVSDRSSATSYSATDADSIAAPCSSRGPPPRKASTADCESHRS